VKDRINRVVLVIAASAALAGTLVALAGCQAIQSASEGNPEPLTASINAIAEPAAAVADSALPGSGLIVKGGAGLAVAAILFLAGRKGYKALKNGSGQQLG
jgi:hypothetical protein